MKLYFKCRLHVGYQFLLVSGRPSASRARQQISCLRRLKNCALLELQRAASMKFISESSESKLISDSKEGDILIFQRKFGCFRAKIYKSEYSKVRRLKKTKRSSWVDVTTLLDPDFLKRGRETSRARLWRAIEN